MLSQSLSVSALDVIEFDLEDDDEVLLGVGQTADDGGFKVTVTDVFLTNGLSGSPRASLVTQSGDKRAVSYSVGLSDYLPEGTGTSILDDQSPTNKIKLRIEDIVTSMNTVTIELDKLRPSGEGT